MDIERGNDEQGRRWYEADGIKAMSVTTVLKYLEEDTTGLEIWKNQNDGIGDSPYHQHLFWFSGPRGTLCHYQVLNEYADEELWGEEERRSLNQMTTGHPLEKDLVEQWHNEGVPVDEREICYSVLKNKGAVEGRDQFDTFFPDIELLDVCYNDVEWFKDTFETVADGLGITQDSVQTVERFLLSGVLGFGGQCDLVYENPDGETVLADLKTSSSLRQKHRLQSVAYSKAIEQSDRIDVNEIDRLEVIRIHPDSKSYQVHSHDEPSYVADTDLKYEADDWFVDPYGDFEYDSLDDMWETFDRLVEIAHNDS